MNSASRSGLTCDKWNLLPYLLMSVFDVIRLLPSLKNSNAWQELFPHFLEGDGRGGYMKLAIFFG